MLTEKQLEERVNYIGSSDAPAVLGLSRWATPLSVWAIKTRQIKPEDISSKLSVKLGHRLEKVVAELFEEETGKKVRRVNETYYHPKHKFLGCNIDRRIVGDDSILELKTASAWKRDEWEDKNIPQEYIVQVLHQLAVTGMKKAWIAVLIGNEDFQCKEIEYDDTLIKDVVDQEVSFWQDYVVTKTMPMVVTQDDAETLQKLFPDAMPDSMVELEKGYNFTIDRIFEYKEQIKGLDKNVKELSNRLKAALKDKEVGTTDLYTISWKNVNKSSYIVPASNSRQLRVKKNKEVKG